MRKKKSTVARSVNRPLKYVREFAPSLTVARASLLPFDELLTSESAGPQNGESCEPYFEVSIDTRQFGEDSSVTARVTAETVTMYVFAIVRDEEGEVEEEYEIDSWQSSLTALWEYLRQLPRHPRSFR
jgi:hypothetical protein